MLVRVEMKLKGVPVQNGKIAVERGVCPNDSDQSVLLNDGPVLGRRWQVRDYWSHDVWGILASQGMWGGAGPRACA